MRYHEIIVESAEENQIINLISKSAAEKVGSIVRQQVKDFDGSSVADYSGLGDTVYKINDMGIPAVESSAVDRALSDLKIKIKYEPHKSNDLDMGGYGIESNTIILNIPDIKTWANHKNRNFDDVVQQTLVHEIQHAVDRTKSGGAALKRNDKTASADSDFAGYLNLPHEINARFTEALLDISRTVADWKKSGETVSSDDLLKLIKREFSANRLNAIDSERLKRLYSRAYKFYQAEMNQPKSVEADSLSRKALNWILGKKTAGTVR